MSDQPENTEAPTAEFVPVEPVPAQPAAAQASSTSNGKKPSNKRAIWAAVAGAAAILLLVLAGLVGYALGSHHNDRGRGDFGQGQFAQMMHHFDGDHGGMMGGFDQGGQQGPFGQQGGPMMGQQQGGQQGFGPGQMPQGMNQTPQTQQ